MSGTDLAVRRQTAALPAKLEYAHELANSGLLPAAFRRQPANVLWAMEYAEMLGLPPMVAMTGIHVIEGKPTASAGLISGLVRKAKHRLRVTGDGQKAVAEITRCDDPDFTFRSEWTLERAKQADLLGKSNWKKYPAAMLKARAITEAARDACEEALYGLMYTPEELGAEVDEDGEVVGGEIVEEGSQHQAPASEPTPEREWLAKSIEAAPDHSDLDTCRAVWRKAAAHVNDRKFTRAEAEPLFAALTARMEALKDAAPAEASAGPPCETGDAEVVEAEIVPDLPDDWADKVGDIRTDEDAAAVVAEANELLGAGQMSDALHREINAAVEAAAASLTPKAA